MKDLIREEGDYFKRQPRVDIAKMNYNFEQYRRYTDDYKKAKQIDDANTLGFYKLVKYVKKNQANVTDPLVHKFAVADGFRADLINVPEEFEGVEFEEAPTFGRKVGQRKIIRKRTDKNLDSYDAWRCSDRQVLKGDGKHFAVAKLMISPASLVRTFGLPDMSEIFYQGTGQISFEDSNLDCFCLWDYRQTDLYHGYNREDSFYLTEANLRKPMHKRKQKYPTIQEFWESEVPVEFKLACDD